MTNSLCFTIRFLRPYCHGCGDGDNPEWPPSPLRFFQALIAASAARWNERLKLAFAVPALAWLEAQPHPILVCPEHRVGTPFRTAVPNNDLDVWAGPISKGKEPKKQPNELKTMKTVRPTHLAGDAVHFLYPLLPDGCPHFEVLKTAACCITHLGWGVDMVVGSAVILTEGDAAKLQGQRWRPTSDGVGTTLRVPKPGSLDALMAKHEAFLNRITQDGFRPVPPLTVFDTVSYRCESDVLPRPTVSFGLLKLDASGYRAFETARRCRDVAAWARHAVAAVCDGWPFDQGEIKGFVHGHTLDGSPLQNGPRFAYLPLPSIERRGDRGNYVGAIRRVLIAAPPGFQDRIDWVRRRLSNIELVRDDGSAMALLNLIPPRSDWVLRRYVESANTWTTVTPVVLPGYDDRDPDKALALLSKAFRHAGFSDQLMKQTHLEMRKVGFLPGVDLADRYALPEIPKVKGPRYHVRVVFPYEIPGPLAVGALRYRGLGLFVTTD
jgi:CRISPR-associated protein Csb2